MDPATENMLASNRNIVFFPESWIRFVWAVFRFPGRRHRLIKSPLARMVRESSFSESQLVNDKSIDSTEEARASIAESCTQVCSCARRQPDRRPVLEARHLQACRNVFRCQVSEQLCRGAHPAWPNAGELSRYALDRPCRLCANDHGTTPSCHTAAVSPPGEPTAP